ncbi:conserved Plasmodium protein, unknown function [Plasmodium ovale wallikeri]|uniref:Uncharacterized protein n=1 Tax=Plasmodium ovale wallikeri TaxID=864142 RepID=A0A1A8YP56_PLAOA|nr:conserved Plasmodium protein, unknown function [Plasmodium ovale wallikeri]
MLFNAVLVMELVIKKPYIEIFEKILKLFTSTCENVHFRLTRNRLELRGTNSISNELSIYIDKQFFKLTSISSEAKNVSGTVNSKDFYNCIFSHKIVKQLRYNGNYMYTQHGRGATGAPNCDQDAHLRTKQGPDKGAVNGSGSGSGSGSGLEVSKVVLKFDEMKSTLEITIRFRKRSTHCSAILKMKPYSNPLKNHVHKNESIIQVEPTLFLLNLKDLANEKNIFLKNTDSSFILSSLETSEFSLKRDKIKKEQFFYNNKKITIPSSKTIYFFKNKKYEDHNISLPLIELKNVMKFCSDLNLFCLFSTKNFKENVIIYFGNIITHIIEKNKKQISNLTKICQKGKSDTIMTGGKKAKSYLNPSKDFYRCSERISNSYVFYISDDNHSSDDYDDYDDYDDDYDDHYGTSFDLFGEDIYLSDEYKKDDPCGSGTISGKTNYNNIITGYIHFTSYFNVSCSFNDYGYNNDDSVPSDVQDTFFIEKTNLNEQNGNPPIEHTNNDGGKLPQQQYGCVGIEGGETVTAVERSSAEVNMGRGGSSSAGSSGGRSGGRSGGKSGGRSGGSSGRSSGRSRGGSSGGRSDAHVRGPLGEVPPNIHRERRTRRESANSLSDDAIGEQKGENHDIVDGVKEEECHMETRNCSDASSKKGGRSSSLKEQKEKAWTERNVRKEKREKLVKSFSNHGGDEMWNEDIFSINEKKSQFRLNKSGRKDNDKYVMHRFDENIERGNKPYGSRKSGENKEGNIQEGIFEKENNDIQANYYEELNYDHFIRGNNNGEDAYVNIDLQIKNFNDTLQNLKNIHMCKKKEILNERCNDVKMEKKRKYFPELSTVENKESRKIKKKTSGEMLYGDIHQRSSDCYSDENVNSEQEEVPSDSYYSLTDEADVENCANPNYENVEYINYFDNIYSKYNLYNNFKKWKKNTKQNINKENFPLHNDRHRHKPDIPHLVNCNRDCSYRSLSTDNSGCYDDAMFVQNNETHQYNDKRGSDMPLHLKKVAFGKGRQ